MRNDELCMTLMRADTEAQVVKTLKDQGYWDEPHCWRLIGDIENNFSTIGNQQSEAVAALIEKIVNGVDARLINACFESGADPVSSEAPATIREAVAQFFEGKGSSQSDRDGRIADWSSEKATREGRLLTLAATGNMPNEGQPSLTVADQGEGHTPDTFPETFMSLHRSNKLRIPFVQGKFNMGGTGALQFCHGKHNIQLIVSRRNPSLLLDNGPMRDQEWGFTIVRRQSPPTGGKNSVYTYLAPVGARSDCRGSVLSFQADTWPIFPEADSKIRDAYHRQAPYGSLVKLYEYEWQGSKSNIVMSRDGLLRRIDMGLPELALPIRLFECRPGYSGHMGSFATNVLGLVARLDRDRQENLESGFPFGSLITVDGKQVTARVFAFKPGKAGDYRTPRHGVIFTVNGQLHGAFPIDFFRRKSVGMSYLADSLLVVIDCSALDGQMREDLFLNSRDRLRDKPLARRLERELEAIIKDEPTLKALRNRRREQELAEKLEDEKPLAGVLESILKSNPLLSKLLMQGLKLSAPFPPNFGIGGGSAGEFVGRRFPTFFRFKGMKSGETLSRDAHLESRVRIPFETDAHDDYFIRDVSPGAWRVRVRVGTELVDAISWSTRGPRSGIAQVWINELPADILAGDEVEFLIEVVDDSRLEAFKSRLILRIVKPLGNSDGGGGGHSTIANAGKGGAGATSSLSLPEIKRIREGEWSKYGFTELTALSVKNAGLSDESGGSNVYDFFVNVDNKFLRIAEKESRDDPKLLQARFVYGMVLVGLALLQDYQSDGEEPGGDDARDSAVADIERTISTTTRALGPILLPMIDAIGGLAIGDDDGYN